MSGLPKTNTSATFNLKNNKNLQIVACKLPRSLPTLGLEKIILICVYLFGDRNSFICRENKVSVSDLCKQTFRSKFTTPIFRNIACVFDINWHFTLRTTVNRPVILSQGWNSIRCVFYYLYRNGP